MNMKNLAELSPDALRGAVVMSETVSIWIGQLQREAPSTESRLALSQLAHRLEDHIDLAQLLLERAKERAAAMLSAPIALETTHALDAAPYLSGAAAAGLTPAEERREGLADAVAAHLAQPHGASAWQLPTAWTQERRELLTLLYPTRMPVAEIRERLAQLPGEPLPNADAVRSYAVQCLFLKREALEIPPGLQPIVISQSAAELEEAGRIYTREREALLRRLYPTTMHLGQIWQRLNALPGPMIRSPDGVRKKAEKLALLRLFQPIPAEFLQEPEATADCGGSAPEAAPAEDPTASSAPIAEPTWRTDWPFPPEDLPEALELIRAGHGALDLQEEFGWNLTDAQAWAEQARQQIALEKKAAA